jgi:hypothetical protein
VLGAEADGKTDDAQTGDGGPDVEAEGLHGHQEGDGQDDHAQERRGQTVQRGLALGYLDGRQLLGRALDDLAIEECGDDGGHADAREAQGDDRRGRDQEQLQAEGEEIAQRRRQLLVGGDDVHPA